MTGAGQGAEDSSPTITVEESREGSLLTVAPAFPPDPQNQQAWELEGQVSGLAACFMHT